MAAIANGELGVRSALGASRWRLVRLLLTENVRLALFAGTLGVAGAYGLVRAFVAIDPIRLPRVHEITIDSGVLALALSATVLTGVLFGIAPALRLSRPDLSGVLKGGSATPAAMGPGGRGRTWLVALEIAFALVLLVSAGLLLRSFVARVTRPLGFKPQGTLALELPFWVGSRIDDLLERLRAVPGVEAAGASSALPHQHPNTVCDGCIEVEGHPIRTGVAYRSGVHVVTSGYLQAAGLTLRRGRFLNHDDGANTLYAAVASESFARRFFPREDPMGRRVRWSGEEWRMIVGVVGDVRGFGTETDPVPALYVSNRQSSAAHATDVLVRTSLPARAVAGPLRRELRRWNERMVIGRIAAMDDLLSESVAVPRFYMLLVSAFAVFALSIAAIGLYATLSHSVARRTREIGVRMALGAEPPAVLSMVLREGVSGLAAGAAIGLAGSWGSTRVLESLLFGVRPDDFTTFWGAATLLLLVGLLACYLPARRATRVDPIEALRTE